VGNHKKSDNNDYGGLVIQSLGSNLHMGEGGRVEGEKKNKGRHRIRRRGIAMRLLREKK